MAREKTLFISAQPDGYRLSGDTLIYVFVCGYLHYVREKNEELCISKEWPDFCPGDNLCAQHSLSVAELKSAELPETPNAHRCLELSINRCFGHLGLSLERHEYPFINIGVKLFSSFNIQ